MLRSKIALSINDNVLHKMPLFEGADPNFLMELALAMKMVCFPPNEDVIIEGEAGGEMFFIFRGAVEVMRGGEQISVLGEQQYFGMQENNNTNPAWDVNVNDDILLSNQHYRYHCYDSFSIDSWMMTL